MPYVYFYIDKKDSQYNYIGIVKDARRLIYRIAEHEEREGLSIEDNVIHYVFTSTFSEADALESDLINRENPRLNKAKKGWGVNNLLNFEKVMELVENEFDEDVLRRVIKDRSKTEALRFIDDDVLLGKKPLPFMYAIAR